MIKDWLMAGNAITGQNALRRFGLYRLSSVIHRLREDGLDIVTEMRTDDDGNQYAIYKLQNPKS